MRRIARDWGVKYAIIVLAVSLLLTIGGLFVVFRGGVELQPERVLNPTEFSKPEEIGAVVARRFWQEIKNNQLVVLGSSSHLLDYDKVWRGLEQVSQLLQIRFDRKFSKDGLREISPSAEPLDFVQIAEALKKGQKVLVQTVSTDQELRDFQESFPDGFYVFQSLYPVRAQQIEILNSECDVKSKELQLACKALKSPLNGKVRKFNKEQLAAVIERHGEKIHFLFISEKSP